jgi:membrane fusion protein, multidrug efflux system
MRPVTVAAVVLVLAGLVVAVERYRTSSSPNQRDTEPSLPVPVVTAPVQQQDVPLILTGIGTVQALNSAVIRSQVTGILEKVNFVEGQAVKRGDVLAQIDPRVYQAQLEQAKAQQRRDQALLTNQQTNLQRNEPLLKQGYATDQQVTGERAQIAQTQNTIQADQAMIDNAQTQLDFTTLQAPFDGVTGIRLTDVGNLVYANSNPGIVVLTQVQPISVVFTLPNAAIPAVQGALERGPVPTSVYDQSGQNKMDQGKLLLINNQADPRSGTVQLKANFPNARRQLWPGTFVNVEVTTSIAKGALTVPTDAVQQNDQGPFVYVVGSDQVASVRSIRIAQRVRGTALVSDGLTAGETVVVQGQYRLKPGTKIIPASPGEVPNTTTATAGMLP